MYPDQGGSTMFKKSSWYALMTILVGAATPLSACGPAATSAPTQPAATQPAESKLAVGIVLPTKDEPRWIQDETRFTEAFEAAGYDVQILFSQGDPAIEQSN